MRGCNMGFTTALGKDVWWRSWLVCILSVVMFATDAWNKLNEVAWGKSQGETLVKAGGRGAVREGNILFLNMFNRTEQCELFGRSNDRPYGGLHTVLPCYLAIFPDVALIDLLVVTPGQVDYHMHFCHLNAFRQRPSRSLQMGKWQAVAYLNFSQADLEPSVPLMISFVVRLKNPVVQQLGLSQFY